MQVGQVQSLHEKYMELVKRKEFVLKTIAEQEKLTPELEKAIEGCWDATELEDLYLPYKPKRRTVPRWHVRRDWSLWPVG